jgi:mono/diheme cytochrome c family protein
MNGGPSDPLRLDQAGASDEQLQRVHAILLREKPEPTEGYSPLPLVLLGLMSAFILFSAIYLGRYSGGFDPMVYDERIRPGMMEGNAVAPVALDPKVLGRRMFMANCAACHQPTGLGLPGIYPPLAGSEWALGPEERIVRIVLHGASGPITVAGKNFNNVMTPFGPLLRDEQLAAVLSYVRSEWGNNAPAVSPDKVKEIRTAVAGHTGPWAPEELLKIP